MVNRKLFAFLKKDILIISRNRSQMFFEIVLPLVSIIPSLLYTLYLHKTHGLKDFALVTGTSQYLSYLACSVIFVIFSIIQEQTGNYLIMEMWRGTLEQIWITPSSKWNLIIGNSIVASVKGILYGGISLAGLIIFSGQINQLLYISNWRIVIFALLFFSINAFSIGMILCSITLKYRQADSIIFCITNLLPIICGIAYPISVLPKTLQYVSMLIPTTYCMDLLRSGVIGSNTIFIFGTEVTLLILITTIYLIIAVRIYDKACKRVEECGTIYMM